ncbi:ribonuclease Y [Nitratidesulfovibrio vulgaris]|uniref:Ribonuclease Y n=2 Tax=Nitratidesulfovibrio vulgaris TaxID=881 RepID=RNY_NITV2|nr:ribonuclease Y [Nitratidesulfovibrio vulgaris]A1VAZ2.1 RecName: Full=Ribonuclease Y; Short=RNase Y [Nitratidesulfovibrio vulgaris DP4]Q728D2.1 RecName: Full=Ribonuclease Y; Short=RNase Y [Nitratidesulfovibrio vulgaris str. Hildenborough]GEB79676.1 ribonuclease Y [Desulfovibrio desulfuricans]HBW15615.1 ribonuclease Y [Desulfovibrio sp.]AAS97143.1 HDIG/HD/KH domain protein [Nitratidesulfovibrio vulgaris str. Hildenborough]ABM27608.1 metal dependent phosphohydrolase [Nitratidesulfovibrio vulg
MGLMIFAYIAIGAVLGAGTGYLLHRYVSAKRIGDANELAKRIVEEARKEAQAQKKEILLQGQDEIFNQKRELENEFKERERELKARDRKLEEQGERLEEKLEKATQKEHEVLAIEKELTRKERRLATLEEELEGKIAEQDHRLEEVSGLTAEEARARIMEEVEARTRHESAKMIRVIEMEARETADRKAKEILASAIQRYAGDYVGEQTVTAVTLPSEDMKGRIIGREGRNIRALEAATGVDLIIDDTPETVILSAYSPLRRQVAKMALERLIQDGRIHPARIEDIVRKCEQELEVQVREVGEQATFDAGVHGIHPDIIKLLGQLRYRTSFSQNVLQHSLEVSALCGMMAAELGMDIKKAKRAGLLHDIGKAVDHEVEGPHALIGADIAKKYGEGKDIIHAIAAHHEDQPPKTALAVLVQAADSISGARPGARKELLENYVKRLEDLENIATGFEGVSKVYAIQAGREIRVMVNSENVDDDQTYMLCKDIAAKIEKNLTYPGQIRVTVIRERRAVGYAK